ncbi:MAG TPA: hypothetical protein VEK08_00490 [Planctomycetota bacterium]|nr:hypothetical protein [Planctomycetota bacterium]
MERQHITIVLKQDALASQIEVKAPATVLSVFQQLGKEVVSAFVLKRNGVTISATLETPLTSMDELTLFVSKAPLNPVYQRAPRGLKLAEPLM